MAPPTDAERLTWPERLKVVGVSLCFVLLLGYLGWLFWAFNPIRNTDWLGKEFWEPIGVGRRRVPKGIVALFTVGFYLILLPVAWLLFVAGVYHGLRGRRTRLTAWLLRQMSQEEARKRHEGMLQSWEAEGELSRMDKGMHGYLRPAVGWGILLGFLVLAVAALVWSATRE
jgi:hypothetical protein